MGYKLCKVLQNQPQSTKAGGPNILQRKHRYLQVLPEYMHSSAKFWQISIKTRLFLTKILLLRYSSWL